MNHYLQSIHKGWVNDGLCESCALGYTNPSFILFFCFRQLKRDYPSAVVLSTDDFFVENGVYVFEPDFLEDAHKWNQKRGD